MADSSGPSGSGPGRGGGSRSLGKFKPNKISRRSESERSAAADQIEQQQKRSRDEAQAAQPRVWQRRERPQHRSVEQVRHAAPTPGPVTPSTVSSAESSSRLPELLQQSSPASPSVRAAELAAASRRQQQQETVEVIETIPVATLSSSPTKSRTKAAPAASTTKIKTEKSEDADKPSAVAVSERIVRDKYSDERNVDHLDELPDSDVEDADDEGPQLRPLNLVRHEHVDRVKNLNTEATSAASARLRQLQLQQQQEKQAERGGYDDPYGNGPGAFDMKDDPDPDIEMHDAPASSSAPAGDVSSKLLAQQTDEDRSEWHRLRAERASLLEELGPATDPAMRDQGIYLFQLPPVLPNLVPPRPQPSAAEPSTSTNTAPSTSLSSAPATTSSPSTRRKGKQKAASSTATAAADPPPPAATADNGSGIKVEGDADADPPLQAPNSPTFAGCIGSLRVYSDGSALMSWGGLEHEVRKGIRGELLQEVVVASGLEEKKDEKEKTKSEEEANEKPHDIPADAIMDNDDEEVEVVPPAKSGAAVGQIKGAYVVTPGWAQLLERAG